MRSVRIQPQMFTMERTVRSTAAPQPGSGAAAGGSKHDHRLTAGGCAAAHRLLVPAGHPHGGGQTQAKSQPEGNPLFRALRGGSAEQTALVRLWEKSVCVRGGNRCIVSI